MMFSINFSSKVFFTLFTVFICFSGCAATNSSVVSVSDDPLVAEDKLRFAVWPVFNLSGTPVPLQDIRNSLIDGFRKQGLNILDEEALERFIVKHRVRYAGGINEATARDLKWETGADAVLITSVELYSDEPPPKIAVTLRLISTGNNPAILWSNGVGLAGDDSIGPLELFLIEDPQKLVKNAVRHLSTSLAAYLSGERYSTASRRKILKFWPRVFFRSPILEPDMKYTVATIPFYNLSGRMLAGDIMALHFVRQLRTLENFTVIEPGIVREALLNYRIIMDDGISLAQTDLLFSKLNVDLILAGKVFDYQDYLGALGTAKVDFSVLLIEKQSREVVWAVESQSQGDDGVFFFDWGRINTAHRLASEMVAAALETLVE